MTAKEKAIQLVDNYRMLLMNEDTDCGNEILCSMIAKQCALIAVDEVIDAINGMVNEESGYSADEYYLEVKTEIEKL